MLNLYIHRPYSLFDLDFAMYASTTGAVSSTKKENIFQILEIHHLCGTKRSMNPWISFRIRAS